MKDRMLCHLAQHLAQPATVWTRKSMFLVKTAA